LCQPYPPLSLVLDPPHAQRYLFGMNLDPFGQIATARFYLSHNRRMLAAAKTPRERELWEQAIAESEARVLHMENTEMEFQMRLRE
jgi:hypothetical protein